jgi:hypothetical protein
MNASVCSRRPVFIPFPPGAVAAESVIACHLFAIVGNVASRHRQPFERIENLDLGVALIPIDDFCRLPIYQPFTFKLKEIHLSSDFGKREWC